MVDKERRIFLPIILTNDIILIILGFYFAYYIRFRTGIFGPGVSPIHLYGKIFLLLIPVWLLIFYLYNLYNWDSIIIGTGEYTRVFTAATVSIFIIIIVSFLAKYAILSRIWLVTSWFSIIIFVVLGRFILRNIIYHLRKRGVFFTNTLIVGADEEGKKVAEKISGFPQAGLKLIGFIDDNNKKDKHILEDVKVLGNTSEMHNIAQEYKIGIAIIISTQFSHQKIIEIMNILKKSNIKIKISTGLLNILTSRVMIKDVGGIPLITLAKVTYSPLNVGMKFLFDIFSALILSILFSPFFLVMSIIIKLESKGPVFYKQDRLGKNRKPFLLLKFRTMVKDADKMLSEIEELNEAKGAIFKIRNDPRITRMGRFLRKFSLDELPQLFNVLKGEMSLVGPRPPLPREVEEYEPWQMDRLNVTPGITGLWQISGRSDLSFDEMVKLDLYYIENWSIGYDLKILTKTIRAVLTTRGAY